MINIKQNLSEIVKHIIIFIIIGVLTYFMATSARDFWYDGISYEIQNNGYPKFLLFAVNIFSYAIGPSLAFLYWVKIPYPDMGLVASVTSKDIPLLTRVITMTAYVFLALLILQVAFVFIGFTCVASMGAC